MVETDAQESNQRDRFDWLLGGSLNFYYPNPTGDAGSESDLGRMSKSIAHTVLEAADDYGYKSPRFSRFRTD